MGSGDNGRRNSDCIAFCILIPMGKYGLGFGSFDVVVS
jgi:hypothetical protein